MLPHRLTFLLAALAVGTTTGCAARAPAMRPAAPVPVVAPSPAAATIVATALSLIGTPYRNGGVDPSGFDCSGLVSYVFGQAGFRVPRTVTALFLATVPVRDAGILASDLVFFRTSGSGASHVGIALGDGRFVHAPSSTGVVRVESLSSRYWTDRYVGARRLASVGIR